MNCDGVFFQVGHLWWSPMPNQRTKLHQIPVITANSFFCPRITAALFCLSSEPFTYLLLSLTGLFKTMHLLICITPSRTVTLTMLLVSGCSGKNTKPDIEGGAANTLTASLTTHPLAHQRRQGSRVASQRPIPTRRNVILTRERSAKATGLLSGGPPARELDRLG